MTDYVWLGITSTSASTNTNWLPNGVPANGDTVTFNASATQKCEWDIALPATAFSVDEVILEDDFIYSLELDVTMRIKALYVGGGTLAAGADGNIKFEHGSFPNEFGSQKSFDERFVMIGNGGTIEQNIIFTFTGTIGVNTYFDNGSYPTVILNSGTFSPQYKTPTGTSGKVSFFDWQIPSALSPTFAPTGDLTDNDRLKIFAPTTFTWSIDTMNFGLATVEFLGTSGGIQLPIKGALGYGTDFLGIYRKVVIKANTAGHRVIMSDNTFLSVEEFEVQDGALFKGAVDDTSQGCEIHCIAKPKINGTWSFSQIAEGIYRSPRHSQGAMGYVNGDFRITGKLTVDGLIDPTGLELTPQASNPSNANTLWLNSGDSNKLYHGSSEVGGGGGGSGTVTSVGFSVPTGFTVSGSPITTSGTLGLAFDTGYALPTSAKQTQWDTAYGWGDHATAGYLTSFTEADPVFSAHPASSITVAGGGDVSKGETAFGWGDHAGVGYLTGETDPFFTVSQAALITNAGSGQVITSAERTKLNGIQAGAEVNVGLQYARWYGINTGANLYTISSGGRQYINWADATRFGESSTGSHPSITLVNAATDYITLAAGGIYQITVSMEIFPNPVSASNDRWLEINTNASANRALGTARLGMFASSGGNWNAQKTVLHEIPTTDPPLDVYVSVFSNGGNNYIRAFDNNRISIAITRLGDASI